MGADAPTKMRIRDYGKPSLPCCITMDFASTKAIAEGLYHQFGEFAGHMMQALKEGEENNKSSVVKIEATADTSELQHQQVEKEQDFSYTVGEFRKSPKSVYMVNFRTVYEDDYPAKFDPELARMLIDLYSNPGDLVIDPLNGSGTIVLTAAGRGRRGWGQDINKEAIAISEAKRKRTGYTRKQCYFAVGDSREVLALDKADRGKAGLALMSPPFGIQAIVGTKKAYGDHKGDITNAPDYFFWRAGLKAVMKHTFDMLMPSRLMIVEIRPRSVDGHDQPMDLWIQNDALEIGFVRWPRMIIEVMDPWRMYTVKDKDNGFMKPYVGHSDILIFKKK
jgi:hypothetical protein